MPIAVVTARATVPSVYPDPSSVETRSAAFGALPVGSVRMAATDREKSDGKRVPATQCGASYSVRKAIVGSMLSARRVGTTQPSMHTPSISIP